MFEALSPITVAGLQVRVCGPERAPTICFLHGGGISGWMWSPQVEALQGDYRCLVPDLPEHGLSATVQPFTIVDTARRVAQLIREQAHEGKKAAEEHAWNLQRPELFNTVTRAWLTDQPLPAELLPLPEN